MSEHAEGARPARRRHGALRDEVLGVVVHAEAPVTARQVVEALAAGAQPPALTTVLTVLDRLHRAGEVDKARADNGELLFSPAGHEPAAVADDMLAALLRSKDRGGALISFAGNLDESDLRVLRRLVNRTPTSDQHRA